MRNIIVVLLEICIAILTYGIIYIVELLLSMCFGFAFTWQIATGIWIVLCLLRWVISAAKPNEKRGDNNDNQ